MNVKNHSLSHQVQISALVCSALISFVLFAVMAVISNISVVTAQETAWLQSIRQYATFPLLIDISIGLAWLGGSPALLIFCAMMCGIKLYQKQPIMAWFDSVAVLGAVALGWFFKEIFDRARPDIWPELVNHFGASFPSNHSLYAVVVAGIFLTNQPVKNLKTLGIIAVLWCLVMGFSRIYLGVHYFTDVLAGWALGIAWVCSLLWVFKRLNFFPISSSIQSGNTSKNHEVTL